MKVELQDQRFTWRLYREVYKDKYGFKHEYSPGAPKPLFLETPFFPVIFIRVAYRVDFGVYCGKCWLTKNADAFWIPNGTLQDYKCNNCKYKYRFNTAFPNVSTAIDLNSIEQVLSTFLECLGMDVFDTILEAREIVDVVGSIRGKQISAQLNKTRLS